MQLHSVFYLFVCIIILEINKKEVDIITVPDKEHTIVSILYFKWEESHCVM